MERNTQFSKRVELSHVFVIFFRWSNPMWGSLTCVFLFGPFLASMIFDHVLMCLRHNARAIFSVPLGHEPLYNEFQDIYGQSWLVKVMDKVPKCVKYFPLFQPVAHWAILQKLYLLEQELLKANPNTRRYTQLNDEIMRIISQFQVRLSNNINVSVNEVLLDAST